MLKKNASVTQRLLCALGLWLLSQQCAQCFYDPGSQRWINRDPIGERAGLNLFAYAGNHLPNEIDPLGFSGGGYGNPVSGPSGPVGPSNPYAPGWPYYPNGFCYKPGPPLIDWQCFSNCVNTWLGGNILRYGAGQAAAGAAYGVGSAPVWFAGLQMPAYEALGYSLGTRFVSSSLATGTIAVGGATVTTSGVVAAAGAGWAAGTVIQCLANCSH
jgi:hypothetical protein